MNNGSTVVVNLTKHRGFEKPDDEQYHVLPLYILDQTDEFGSMQGQIEKVQRGSLEVLSRYRTQVRMRSTPYRPCKRNRTTPKKQGLKKSPKKIKLAKSKSFPPGKYQENGEKNGENKFSEDGFFLPSSPADEVRSDRSQGTAAPGVGLEERKQENMSYTDLMSQQGTPGFNDLYTNFWDYFYTHGEFPPREWTSKRKFSVTSKAVSNGYSSNSVSQPPAADQMFLHQQQQRQWQHQEQQRQQQQQQLNIKVQDQNRQQQRQQVSPHHVAANKGFHFTAPSPQTPFPLMSPRQHSPHPQNHQWTSSSVAGITKTSQTSAMPQSPASLPLQATHGPQHISNVPGPPTPIPPDALHLQASNAAQSNTSSLSQTSNGQSQRSQFPAVSQSSFSSTASFNSHNLHSIEPNTLQHPQDARSCPPNNVNSCNDSKIMASHSNFTREANMFSHMSPSSQDSTGHKFNMSESNTTAERDVKEGQGPFNLKQVTRHVPYHHKHMSYPYTRQDALPQPISSYTSQGVLSSLNKNVAQREHSGYVPAHEISSTYCDTRSPQGQHMYQSGRAAAGHLVQRSISEHSGSRPSSTQPIERPASEQLFERPGSVQAELSFVADQLSGRSVSAHSLQRPSSAQGPASNQSVERPSSTHSIHDSIFRPPSAHSLERPPSQSFGGTQFAQSMQIPPSIQPARRATSVPSVDRPHSAQLEHAASPVQFLARPVSAQPGEGSSPVTSGQFSVHQLTGHKPSPELRASPKVEMQSDVTRFTLQLPESSIHKKPGFFSPLQSGSSMMHISSVSCDSQLQQSVNRQCWLGLNEPAGESAVTRPPTSSNESCHSGDQGRGQLNKLVVDVLKGQQNIKSSHLPQNEQVHSDVRSEQFNVEDNNHQSGHMNMPRLGQMAQDAMHKEQTFGFGRNHHGIGADSGYRKQTSLSVGYGGQITDNHGEMERKNSLHEPAVPVNAVPYIQGQNPVGTLSNQRPGQHLLHAPPQRNSIFGEGSGNVHTSEQNSGSMSAHPIPSSHGSTEGPQRIVSALMSQGTGTGLPNQFSHNNVPLSGQDTTVYPNGLMAGEMMKVHKSEGFVVPKHDQGPSEPPYSVIDSTVISEKVDDNREVFEDPAMGGVAIALCHGAVLFEVAKRELHATTALKEPNRYQPKRISLVFYQHKNLNLARHGYDEYERKAEERRNQAEQARLIEEMESKGFFKGELSELAAFPNLQNGTFGKVFDFPESKKPLFPLRFPRYLDCSPQEQITPVLFACMSIAFPKYMKEAFPNPNPMGLPRLMYGRMPVRMNSSLSDKRKNGHQEDMEQLDKNLKFMIEKYVECGGSQQDQRYIWNPNIPQGHSVTTNSIITRWVHDDTSVTGPYNKWVEMVLQEAVRSKAGTNKNETGADKEENVTENPSQHDTHEHVKERDLQTNVPTDKEPSGPSQTSQEVVTSTAAQLSHPEQSHSTSVPGPVPRSGSSAEGRLQLSPSDNSDGHNSVTSMDRSHDHLPKDHMEAAALMNPTETENCKTNDYMNCLWPEVDVVSDKSGHFATTNKKIYENNGFSQKVFERSQPVSGYFTKKEDRAKYVGSHKIQGGESIENHLSNKIMKCDESDRAGTNRSVPANLYPNNHVRSLGNNQLVQEETNDTSPGKRNQIATYTGNKDMLALKQDMISVSDNPLGEFTIGKEICVQGNITETTYLKQEVHADPPLQVSKHAPLSDKPDGHPSSSANIEAEVTEQKYQCEQGQEKAFHDAGKRESMYDFIMKGLKEPFSSRQLYNTPNIPIPFAGGNCGDSNVPRQCETAADGNA